MFADSLAASPDLFARVLPKVFLDKHLALDPPLRPSLRPPLAFRDCKINTDAIPNTVGSAVVRMGDAVAICGITAFVHDAPSSSSSSSPPTLYTNIDLVGRGSSPPLPEYMALSHSIFEAAAAARLYDPAQLRINDFQTLVLQAQIQLLSPTCQADVAWAALVSALRSTLLPTILPSDDTDINNNDSDPLFSSTQTTPLLLSPSYTSSLPWCINFGLARDNLILADIDGRVEDLSIDSRLTLILSATTDDDSLISVSLSSGSNAFTKQIVKQCVDLARSRAAQLDRILLSQI
ncbi:hypothetical protein BZA70DRAFT_284851 [Myxozyma melibiosi]|uniref:Ribosomal RNA-processing protein 43 n=1 Tax=Myxozyma melibiosi TaxID=54550 RepID=A0ABR1EYU2_9ASCO